MQMGKKLGQQYLYHIKQVLKQNCKMRHRTILHNEKGSIQQEDIIVVNIYTPNRGTPKYIGGCKWKKIVTSSKWNYLLF